MWAQVKGISPIFSGLNLNLGSGNRAVVKLHTPLNLRRNIPNFPANQRRLRFKRLARRTTDRSMGAYCDRTIILTVFYSKQGYPKPLRCIRFKDPETDKTLIFLTNHPGFRDLTVCQLYRMRWQVAFFFKWIKQHLRIKAFVAASENAAKTQIWIAVCTFVLVTIVHKRLELQASTH